ncbi:Peroxisome size and maintenance regulator [Coemansia sp. IMI 203386]|nr:Peroxisome size and maintenance regulator [Coemansia sp. IMI 203386]
MHDFTVTTFLSPTYCRYCRGLLWGLAKQGVRCSECQITAHKKCAVRAAAARCSKDAVSREHSEEADALGLKHTGPSDRSSRREDEYSREYMRQLDAMFWQQVDEETKINTMVSAQAEQPLSLFQTLPANFMQFTAKLAPVSLIHRGASDILMWKRPRRSLIAMCVYSMYCLRPNLILATPLALMIAYIIFNYFNSGYAYSQPAKQQQQQQQQQQWSESSSAGSPQQSSMSVFSSGFFNIVPLASTPSPMSASPGGPSQIAAGSTMASIDSSAIGNGSSSNSSARLHGSTGKLRLRSRSQTTSGPYPSIVTDRGLPTKSTNSTMDDIESPSIAGLSPRSPTQTSPKARVLVRNRSMSPDGGVGSYATNPSIDLAAVLGVASFGSNKYTDNVHTTQTLTGTYVKAYDWAAAHNYLVDWSQPVYARRILQACLAAQIAVMVVVYYVPWYLLFLVGGNSGLLLMSPHVRAFLKVFGVEFLLYLHELIEIYSIRARVWLRRLRIGRRARGANSASKWTFVSPKLLAYRGNALRNGSNGDDGIDATGEDDDDVDENGTNGSGYRTPPLLSLSNTPASSTTTLVRRPHTVSVFENQRWWLGFGWIPRLGGSERAKWSDESGRRSYASLSDFMPEDGYAWADDAGGWEIDRVWALPVGTDDDGWVYTDNFWKRPSSTASTVSSYTRRRKWVRRMRPLASRVELTRSAASVLTPATK